MLVWLEENLLNRKEHPNKNHYMENESVYSREAGSFAAVRSV
jgi:hypothetical protein